MTIEDFDAAFDSMVSRIDAGDECPNCHSHVQQGGIRTAVDVTGKPLFVCGCSAQWTSYTHVIRPREVA